MHLKSWLCWKQKHKSCLLEKLKLSKSQEIVCVNIQQWVREGRSQESQSIKATSAVSLLLRTNLLEKVDISSLNGSVGIWRGVTPSNLACKCMIKWSSQLTQKLCTNLTKVQDPSTFLQRFPHLCQFSLLLHPSHFWILWIYETIGFAIHNVGKPAQDINTYYKYFLVAAVAKY